MFDKISNALGFNRDDLEANAKRKILIVEDNEVDQKLIHKSLEKLGFQFTLAENGQVGLDKVKSDKLDLIICDCDMPVMTGHELIKTLKCDKEFFNIPVIFLTSIDTPKNIIECFELDAENYLAKPVNPSLLSAEVKKVFSNQSS